MTGEISQSVHTRQNGIPRKFERIIKCLAIDSINDVFYNSSNLRFLITSAVSTMAQIIVLNLGVQL